MKETSHADRNEGGPLLSVVEGQEGEVERGSHLPSKYPTIVANGKEAREQKARTRLAKVNGKFLAELSKRAEHYRSDALDQLHEIAMLPITDDGKALQVKFLAASKLVDLRLGGEDASTSGFDLGALREAYRQQSVRIKQVREKTTTYLEPDAKTVLEADGDG